MNLTEHWATLRLGATRKVALILDPSESAAECRQQLVSLVRCVLEILPADSECSVWFLGNAQPYDSRLFAVHGGQWLQENRGRTSLISPVLEALAASPEIQPVVIGSGRIFDLEDWDGDPLGDRLWLVSLGAPLDQPPSERRRRLAPVAHDIGQQLQNPVTRVVIEGEGFLPLWWSNDGYLLEVTATGIRLSAVQLADYDLTLGHLGAGADAACATVTRSDGSEQRQRLDPGPAVVRKPRLLGRLTEAEAEVFGAARRRQSYRCPLCGGQHEWRDLWCERSGGVLGQPVYAMLPDDSTGSFLLQPDPEGVRVYEHPHPVLCLEGGRAVIRRGGHTMICRYSGVAKQWLRAEHEAFEPYTPVGEDLYAICL